MINSYSMAKREFNDQEMEDARRLKALIDNYISDRESTQSEFAARCGWSQGVVYQYTKPERALGIETTAVFANALNVKIDQISPKIADQIRKLNSQVIYKQAGSRDALTKEEQELLAGYRAAGAERREDMLDAARKALFHRRAGNE